MSRRVYLTVVMFFTLILLIGANFSLTLGWDGDSKIITVNQDLQCAVDQAGQKREMVIPQAPLDFDSMLTWKVTVAKKSFSTERIPAGFTIEEMGTAKQVERQLVSSSGKLLIPKGKQYKVILDSGEYMTILIKTGAAVKADLSFAAAQIKYELGDKPFLINFEITGPAGLDNWKWQWNNEDSTTGKTVAHQFTGPGKTIIMVEGDGKILAGLTSSKYSVEFEIPPLVILNSKIEPMKGPAELAVTTSVTAVVNYGQKAAYSWNFGNGIEISGPEAHQNYQRPGHYQVTLTTIVNEAKIEKTWVVEVSPETVLPNITVTPALGPVPLKVTGTLNPKIDGGPAQLEYTWNIAGEDIKGANFEHTFTEPGDYRLMVQTIDKLHPEVIIPEEIILIKALPPQINLKATVSTTTGIVPLAVYFDPGITVAGTPVDLDYRWEFGDGEISNLEKPSHTFKNPGEYQVRLIVNDRLHSGNLVDTAIPVTVMSPQLKVTVKPNLTDGMAPLQVNFNAETSVTGSPCEPQYCWNFNDGAISFEQNPVHLFKQPGEYQVTLEVKDRYHPEVTGKVTTQIEVQMPKLRLTASVSPNSGLAPLTIKCQAAATEEEVAKPNLKFVWDFGDGKTVEGPEPSYTYEKAGTYNIQVSVQDDELGISTRKTLKVTVK